MSRLILYILSGLLGNLRRSEASPFPSPSHNEAGKPRARARRLKAASYRAAGVMTQTEKASIPRLLISAEDLDSVRNFR